MPTIFIKEGYRFFFFSNEHLPKHVHVEKAENYAKIELENFIVNENYGFTSKEIKKILKIIKENNKKLTEAWNGHFKKT